MPRTDQELAQLEANRRGLDTNPRNLGYEAAPTSWNPFNPAFRDTVRSALYDYFGGSNIAGREGYRTGQLVDTAVGAIDFIPGVGDAIGVGDLRQSAGSGDLIGTAFDTAALAAGVVPVVGDAAARGIKASESALRNFMPGEFEYDPGFGVRARERDQINQTEFRFSPRVVEEPKEISIFDLEGRPFVTTQSDRTDAGRSLLGIGEVDFDIPVELLGGQGYMFRNPGELWASGSGVTPKIYEPAMLAKKNFALGGTVEDPLLLPYRMSPKGSDFSHMTTDTMLTYARNAMDSKTIKRADSEIKSVFPDFKGIQNPESMRQLSSQPDPIRGRVRDILDKNFRYEGSLDLPTTRLAITEPGQYAGLLGGLQNVGQFDLSQGLFRGTHPSYPSTVPGYGLGQLKEKDISIFELMPEYVQYRGPVRTMYSKSGKPYQVGIDPTFSTTPVQTEIYSMQTGVRGAPGQQDPNRAMQFTGVITEDILRGIEARRSQ